MNFIAVILLFILLLLTRLIVYKKNMLNIFLNSFLDSLVFLWIISVSLLDFDYPDIGYLLILVLFQFIGLPLIYIYIKKIFILNKSKKIVDFYYAKEFFTLYILSILAFVLWLIIWDFL